MTFSNYMVSDQNGPYQIIDSWDIKASFEAKARKGGIVYTEDGYEICFGISQYGPNKYNFSYHLDQVVARYDDVDGANFRFINDQMNTGPTAGMIIIRLANGQELTAENARIWSFGYEGQVEFRDGYILAYSQTDLGSKNHMTVMFEFDQGLIEPSRRLASSFSEVRDQAFLGSDYGGESEGAGSGLDNLSDGALYAIMVGLAASYFAMIQGVRKLYNKILGRTVWKIYEEYGYYRDIPNQGNMSASYLLANGFHACPEETILAVNMMRLVEDGYLIPKQEDTYNFLMRHKVKLEFSLSAKDTSELSETDQYLYKIIEYAAGKDKILQEKELKRYAKNNDKVIRAYMAKCELEGWKYLKSNNLLVNNSASLSLKNLNDQGRAELGQIVGMKKYLEDFSLIAERGISELPLWRELLRYALLFGVADKLLKELKHHYPELVQELDSYSYSMATVAGMQTSMYSGVRAAEAARSSGGGGSSSSGGGGGSSGGGSGGGSR